MAADSCSINFWFSKIAVQEPVRSYLKLSKV
jgi:hypothetical protein